MCRIIVTCCVVSITIMMGISNASASGLGLRGLSIPNSSRLRLLDRQPALSVQLAEALQEGNGLGVATLGSCCVIRNASLELLPSALYKELRPGTLNPANDLGNFSLVQRNAEPVLSIPKLKRNLIPNGDLGILRELVTER